MKPFVSIITPTYNHESFITHCINSVINQTYTNWEMIIIDDRSSDNTPGIILNYANKDNRIKFIKHKKNWGIKNLVRTYNQALKLAQGKYIAILEGDDFWPKNKLAKQMTIFKNKDIAVSFGDCIITDQKGNGITIKTYKYDNVNSMHRENINQILSIIPATAIICKNNLTKIKGFQSDNHYPFIDIPTWLKLSLNGKFYYENQILGYHRKSKNSSWFDFVKKTKAAGREEIYKCVLGFSKKYQRQIIDQQEYIQTKKKNKELTVLLHYITFKEIELAKTTAVKILKSSKQTIKIKTITLFLLIILPVSHYVSYLNFIITLYYYKINQMIRKILYVIVN